MPPAAIAGAGLGVSALGNLYGTHEQSQAAHNNFVAQQSWQQMLNGLVQGQMQNGQNPFASQLMSLFGPNPQLQTPGQAQSFTYDPATVATPSPLTAPEVTAPGAVSASTVTPGTVNAPTVAGPTFGESWNVGQDSLMQMLRQSFNPQIDQGLQSNLQDLYGGSTFDASKVIDALKPIDQRLIDEQASQLRGSTAGLGERFGSAAQTNERDLRERFLQDITGRNAQLSQNAFESGQNRRLQALGLGAQREQSMQQLPLQFMGLQQNAAQQLLGAGFNQAQLGQQLGLANASNSMQAQGMNQQAGLQAGLANQQAGLQAGQFNASQLLQAALANQQAGMQTGQFNNQMLAQLGLSNANLLNQGGQFNAQQQMAAQGQNMNQANLFNQLLMGGIGQAYGMQQGQNGLNAQLLGILGGIGVPQQQPGQLGGAIGGLGENATLMALLPSLLGGGGGGYNPINFGSPYGGTGIYQNFSGLGTNTPVNPYAGWR